MCFVQRTLRKSSAPRSELFTAKVPKSREGKENSPRILETLHLEKFQLLIELLYRPFRRKCRVLLPMRPRQLVLLFQPSNQLR